MSGYAARLKPGVDRGALGLRAAPHPARAVRGKARALADLVRGARHVVVHTGAGLSTAAGIPDFRGVDGVWTRERDAALGRPVRGENKVGFEAALPTLAHVVVAEMWRAGKVKYVVSQNVDALHLRSGLAREALSELHGNLFVEACGECGAEYLREYELPSVGFAETGRVCDRCGGKLADKALDWDDALPEPDFSRALEHSAAADVVLVLGSSCQMDPARNLPFRTKKPRVRTALINLSPTKMDDRFSLVIRADCDTVLALLAHELGLSLPRYQRAITLHLRAERLGPKPEPAPRVKREDAPGDASPPAAPPPATLRCSVWADANAGPDDRIPLVAHVDFEAVGLPSVCGAAARAPVLVRVFDAPYAVELRGVGADVFAVRATAVFVGGASATWECLLGGVAARHAAVAAAVDYAPRVAALVAAHDAAVSAERKRPAYDPMAWFARTGARKLMVTCASCLVDIAACKKREHFYECVLARAEHDAARKGGTAAASKVGAPQRRIDAG